jgi:hypothetical protein
MRNFLVTRKHPALEIWYDMPRTWKLLGAAVVFFGIGELLFQHFWDVVLPPYMKYVRLGGVIGAAAMAGVFVGYWLKAIRADFSSALSAPTYRGLSRAIVYQEINQVITDIVRRSGNLKKAVNLSLETGQPQVLTVLERVKWILGEKVYNISLHLPLHCSRHIIIAAIIPPDPKPRPPFLIDGSASGQAFRNRETVILRSVRQSGVRYAISTKYRSTEDIPYSALLCVPLLLGSLTDPLATHEVPGVLCVSSKQDQAFSDGDHIVLTPILPQLALLAYLLGAKIPECPTCRDQASAELNPTA